MSEPSQLYLVALMSKYKTPYHAIVSILLLIPTSWSQIIPSKIILFRLHL